MAGTLFDANTRIVLGLPDGLCRPPTALAIRYPILGEMGISKGQSKSTGLDRIERRRGLALFARPICSICLADGRTCTKQLAGASGFYLVFAYIRLWSPTCTALDGEKATTLVIVLLPLFVLGGGGGDIRVGAGNATPVT
jgi:hypothetical protein